MTALSVGAAGAAAIQARMDGTAVGRWHRNVARLLGVGCFFNFFEVALGSLIVTLLPATWVDTSAAKAAVIACAFDRQNRLVDPHPSTLSRSHAGGAA